MPIKHEKLNNYWVYGKYPVLHILKNENRKVNQLLLSDNAVRFLELNGLEVSSFKDIYQIMHNYEISKLVNIDNLSHQGIAVNVSPILQPDLYSLTKKTREKKRSTIVILDQIVDPHNIGAIIRSSAAFGADAVMNTRDNSPAENATILKSACGAFESMPYVQVTNLSSAIKDLKSTGYWIIGLTHHAKQDIKSINIDFEKIAIILGSEEKGIRKLSIKQCDLLLKISISQTRNVESLNVSNAAAIALYHIWNH